jgi:hypothetical protein
MIPAEACPGTFVTLKGACGKTTNNNRSYSGWQIFEMTIIWMTIIHNKEGMTIIQNSD